MAQFTPDQVNQTWGFYGTLRDTFPMALPMTVYNHVVDMLGGDPNVARQYLDSTAGRHFVDALTFVVQDRNVTAKQLIQAINKNKMDKNLAGFFKRFVKFQPYEDPVEEEPTAHGLRSSGSTKGLRSKQTTWAVERLLSED